MNLMNIIIDIIKDPVTSPLFVLVTKVLLVGYAFFLYHITGRYKNTNTLIWSFGIIGGLGIIYHFCLFSAIDSGIKTCIPRIFFSVKYALEMFVANTIIFKDAVKKGLKDYYQLCYNIYFPLYGMAVLTSGFAIFHFLSRRLYNWCWLTFHRSKEKTHIFIGINEASLCLANDIRGEQPKVNIVFIDLPDQQDNLQGISVWSIIARFFNDNKDSGMLRGYVVLKAGKGINKIVNWLKNKENRVYVLTDSQETNVAILEALWGHKEDMKCTVYCHAKKEELINRYDNLADVDDRIRFVDSSFLSVVLLKKIDNGAMLPVNYVDIAEEPKTLRKLGYVTSTFNCAIIGFGETGKEALKFLYEFASFPDKENGKAPFRCHVFDDNLTKELGEFGIDLTTFRSPESLTPEFELHQSRVGSISFREELSRLVKDLNYIVVCLGNDDLNVETALNIVEWAEIEGRDTSDKFCVAIRQTNTSKLNQDTLDKANEAYNGCLQTFGMTKDIWKMHIINNEELDSDARKFYESYKVLSDVLNKRNEYPSSPTWEEREKKGIRSKDYKERCKARRQKAQDYSNSLHKTTKRMLCEPYADLEELIYIVNDNSTHCAEVNKEILEHLAVCEHLRWEASHMLMGYEPTTGKTDDLKKLHNCIKSYKELDEVTKHYDWLVVKNSL